MPLDRKKRYLQIAFNSDAARVLRLLPRIPRSDRIIIEAGTPYIKKEGENGIRLIRGLWNGYLVADIKTADGAVQEVLEARRAGANAATVLGSAPIETINLFVQTCQEVGMDSFVDTLGVEDPLRFIRKLKAPPTVVILHIGRDEETTRGKLIQYRHISRIRSKYAVLFGAAGGVGLKEAQTASFNGANIVVVNVVEPGQPWKGIRSDEAIEKLAVEFLRTIE